MTTDLTIEMTFERLERCLAMAAEGIPVTHAEELLQWLDPDANSSRQLILSELIKLDMTRAGELGVPRYLEFYHSLRTEFPSGGWPLDVVLEELQQQQLVGQVPRTDELIAKYPHLADAIQALLSTSQSRTSRPKSSKLPPLSTGDVVDDFEILHALGTGAFAQVYLAKQLSMKRLVALKVSDHPSDESIVLSQLDHPNIVRVYDQRPMPNSTASMLYMQFVPGGTLVNVIAKVHQTPAHARTGQLLIDCLNEALLASGQQGVEHNESLRKLAALPWGQIVADIGQQLALGLAHAHDCQVMHRDIKPANILLSIEGVPKLADFNVSFVNHLGANAASHFGGSIPYMSPEQLQAMSPLGTMRADQLDDRSDLYSLAIVLWELWRGSRPWTSDAAITNWYEALQRQLHLREQPLLTSSYATSSSDRMVERTLRAALSVDRDQRPSTGLEMAAKLRLATHPRAAMLFEPDQRSWIGWLGRQSIYLLAAILVFVPNGIAAAINFQFNRFDVERTHPELREYFGFISLGVNSVAFSLGSLFFFWIVQAIDRGLKRVASGQPATEKDLQAAWGLGHRAAIIGAVLWIVAGLVFPIALRSIEPRFQIAESTSFFLSLLGCGGMACIYPFFGLSLVCLHIYYPRLVAKTMTDFGLRERILTMKRRDNFYLAAGALVPLMILGLLMTSSDVHRAFQGICLAFTALALLVAFFAHQRLLSLCQVYTDFLSIPGPSQDRTPPEAKSPSVSR